MTTSKTDTEKLADLATKHEGALAELKTANEQVVALTKERDEHKARADAAEKRADKATAGGKRATSAAAAKDAGRKAGKLDWGENDVDRPKPAELLEEIEAAETVEVVATDGERELRAFGAMPLQGNEPFRTVAQGLLADVGDGTLHGPGLGVSGGSVTIKGFALMLDGKQKAYAPLLSPVAVGPGQTVGFRDAIIF
jgi:hypothetical protein